MQREKIKKIKLNLFQEVKFVPESVETMLLVLLCAVIFGISFFASGKLLFDYSQKEKQNALNGKPKRQIVESVLAAEDQKNENMSGAEENVSPDEKKVSEVMSSAADSVKDQASRVVRVRKIARQRAASIARIRSGPVPTGPTIGLPDGRRLCDPKNDYPQGGGKIHVDEDCCPDPNETPNPRCYYTPGQLGIMKGR